MILVTGATGNVGSEVVRGLLAAGQQVRAFVRDEDPAAARLPGGVDVARGDLAAPSSIQAALRGVDRLYLLSPMVPGMTQLEAGAIAAATKAAVRLIVKHSILVTPERESTLQRWHRAGEALIERSGVAWTFVRPTAFMSNALEWIGMIKSQGAVYYPGGDGKVSVVDPRDIAAVAVKALTEEGHEGKAYDVTGPEALSTGEQVALIAEAIGKPVRYVDIPDAAARDSWRQMGLPDVIFDALLEFTALARAGKGAGVSKDVESVTGHPARTFAAWTKENAAMFR